MKSILQVAAVIVSGLFAGRHANRPRIRSDHRHAARTAKGLLHDVEKLMGQTWKGKSLTIHMHGNGAYVRHPDGALVRGYSEPDMSNQHIHIAPEGLLGGIASTLAHELWHCIAFSNGDWDIEAQHRAMAATGTGIR